MPLKGRHTEGARPHRLDLLNKAGISRKHAVGASAHLVADPLKKRRVGKRDLGAIKCPSLGLQALMNARAEKRTLGHGVLACSLACAKIQISRTQGQLAKLPDRQSNGTSPFVVMHRLSSLPSFSVIGSIIS